MSIVKIKFTKDVASRDKYFLSKDQKYVSTIFLRDGDVAGQFLENQKYHNRVGDNQAICITQSWGEEESKKLSSTEINNFGRELAERYFADHQVRVVTHLDTKCNHNHIMVDPVNFKTGKRVWNKKEHLHNLRGINDEISRENGLSVIEKVNTKSKVPQKARKAEHYSSSSRLHDLKKKLIFLKSMHAILGNIV